MALTTRFYSTEELPFLSSNGELIAELRYNEDRYVRRISVKGVDAMVWLLIVVLLVVLAILWLFRKRWRRNKAIQILLYHSQRLTDQAMTEALQQLGISTDKSMTSKPIADIWGHGDRKSVV